MTPRDEQIEFIRLNGRRLAACAWQGYQDKGRGLVCVMSDLEHELLHLDKNSGGFGMAEGFCESALIRPTGWHSRQREASVFAELPGFSFRLCSTSAC